MPEQWWKAFEDEQLNTLVTEAIHGNFNLKIAWDRREQARATAVKAGAPMLPSLDGTGGYTRSVTYTEAGDGGKPPASKIYRTDFSLGLVASYEVDLWGRVRSTSDAAALAFSATEQDLSAAAITLTSDIARTWFRLVEQRQQLHLLSKQIETNEKSLKVITLRFRQGQGGATDVLQQRQVVASAKGDRILVKASIEVLKNQLALLLGRPPGKSEMGLADTSKLPPLPPLPQTGLPIEWMRHRPDVCAAEIRVAAADRRLAGAIADRFPRIGITLSASTSSQQVRDLFDNWMASIVANIVAPLFDGGLRRAEVDRERASLSEKLNAYGQVVLQALAEVENALIKETRQSEYVQSLDQQLALAKTSTEQVLDNYTKGKGDFTRYLTTLLSYQKLQRTVLQARRDMVLYRIDLYRSLAGHWTLPQPEQATMTKTK